MAQSATKAASEGDVKTVAGETLDFDDDNLRAIAEVFNEEGNDSCAQEDFNKAVHFYTEGIKVNCQDEELKAKLYSNRAEAYFCLGSFTESLSDAKVAYDLQPSLVKAIVQGACCCFQLNQFQEAIIWCEKGLAMDKTDQTLLDLKSRCVNEQNKRQDTSREESAGGGGSDVTVANEETLDAEEVNLRAIAEVFKNEGDEEFARKEFGSAVYFYSEGINLNCKDQELKTKLHSNRASAHFFGGNYHDSLRDAKIAIGLTPSFMEAIERGASACVKLNQFEEAIMWCENGLKIDNNNQRLLELRNRSEREKSHLQDTRGGKATNLSGTRNENATVRNSNTTIDYYECYIRIAKERGHKSREGMAYGELGIAHCRLGGFKKAKEYLELSLKIAKEVGDSGGEQMAYCNLGISYGSLGDFKEAIDCFECAAKSAKAMGDISGEGTAYSNLGSAYCNLGDFKEAVNCHERSLEIAKKVGNKSSEGHVYGNLGNDYNRLGDFKKAIDYYERSLEIAKETGDIAHEGNAYSNLGNAYLSLGAIKKAIDYQERHLAIVKLMGDVVGEGKAYGNLGLAYDSLGDFKKAIDYHECSLKVAKQVGDLASEGKSYGSLACTYDNIGDFKKAIPYHERSLEIAKKVGDKPSEAKSYCNLGIACCSIGDFKKAIDCYERSMEIAKEVGALEVEGNVSCNLGIAYGNLGDFKKAKECHEHSLKIVKQLGEVAVEGKVCSNLGNAYYNLGDFERAIDCHQDALKIEQKVGDTAGEGRTYSNLGDAYYSLGDFEEAKEYHERDLKIAKDVGDIASEGSAYGNLGKVYHSQKEFTKAMDFHERHLKIAKQVGDKVQIGTSLYNIGAVFQSLGSFDEAVDYYRHSVATFNDVRRRLEFKDEWKISLRNLHQSAYASLWRLLAKQEKIVEALLSSEQGRAQALKDLMELKYGSERKETDSGTESGESADALLSCFFSNTVFMALEAKDVIFWVLQKGKNVQLRRKQISEGDANANTILKSLMRNTMKKIGVKSGIKCEDRSLDMKREEDSSDESSPDEERGTKSPIPQKMALSKLYETIVSPIEDLLLDNEVIFVPEGPLCLAPFAAFMDPNSKYLCESFRIRLIPSLTSLKLITDCPTDYHCTTGALVVGDPWVQEVRYQGQKLEQLPSAREEAQVIARIVHTDPLIGEEATKDEVLKRLSSVTLVHIAAHGRMQTGEIALAPNATRTSQAPVEADYLLTMREVLSVHMQARLVVLSCCHSAEGEIKAEGVVGIARAFLGAGAQSVLVSLWAIDDKATLEFMKRFYQHLVENKSASEALNQAMNSMRESDEFGQVKYWAPFVLIGDDVTLEFAEHK